MSSSPVATTAHLSQWTELASRENDGLVVFLLWNPLTDNVKVTVSDARLDSVTSGDFELHVDGADALSAFYHPFAFAADEDLSFAAVDRDSADLQLQS